MPFTPAHPAIILPLLRVRRLSATGLIVGTVTPDFEYFFKLSVNSRVSHTWWGVLYFDIPVVLLLSIVFHVIVKQQFITNLPAFLQKRFHDTLMFDFIGYLKTNFLFFLISAAIGSASHIFWDSFTHENGFFVNAIPFYKDVVVPYDGARYPLFYALQHFSTAIGLLLVSMYIMLKKPQSLVQTTSMSVLYWPFIVFMAMLVVAIRFMIHSADYNIGNLVVSCISGICLAMIMAGFVNFTPATKR